MSRDLEFIDIQSLSTIQNSISEITDLHFSTYDSDGTLLIPAKSEDSLIVQIKSYTPGREEYEKFIRSGIEKASVRKDAFVIKGPANQNHLFIPVAANDLKFVLVSGPFYLSMTDFREFLIKKGQHMGISPSHFGSWLKVIKVKDYTTVEKMTIHIKSIFEAGLQSSYEKKLDRKRYQWAKTLIDVLYNIQLPISMEEVYSIVLDSILFIFNVDTISIMVKGKNIYKTVMVKGRLKNSIGTIYLEDNPLISRSIEKCIPTSTNDIMEISRLGLPDSITSIHIFPIACKGDTTQGAVFIYNSIISREEAYSILEFCKIVCFVLKNLHLQNAYDKFINDMTMLDMAVTKLTPQLHSTDALCETIVDTAAEILNAEKGSLMLPEENDLLIKAVKGINKWLTKDIRIKPGEGIAGNVFKDGRPFLVKDIGETEIMDMKPKSHYKTASFVSSPLRFGSDTIGVLNISDKATGEEFTERDLNLLTHFASYASIALKVSSYYNMAEQMKELSITDPLTGLFNRRYLQEHFTEEIHRSERHGFVFSLALLDIDDFKLFNDTEGHLAGDNVLKEVARILRECVRLNDVPSRFGGEEFLVLMPQTDKEEASLVAERIRENIKKSLYRDWRKFPLPGITVSIGVASFPDDGSSVYELTKNADIALYKAKAMGKNRVVIFGATD